MVRLRPWRRGVQGCQQGSGLLLPKIAVGESPSVVKVVRKRCASVCTWCELAYDPYTIARCACVHVLWWPR